MAHRLINSMKLVERCNRRPRNSQFMLTTREVSPSIPYSFCNIHLSCWKRHVNDWPADIDFSWNVIFCCWSRHHSCAIYLSRFDVSANRRQKALRSISKKAKRVNPPRTRPKVPPSRMARRQVARMGIRANRLPNRRSHSHSSVPIGRTLVCSRSPASKDPATDRATKVAILVTEATVIVRNGWCWAPLALLY